MSRHTDLINSFTVSVQTDNVDFFAKTAQNVLTSYETEQELRADLFNALSEVPAAFELPALDIQSFMLSAALEKAFFEQVSCMTINGTTYTLSALQFETDDLFSQKSLTRDFFVDVSEYLKQNAAHGFKSLNVLNAPFCWAFQGPIPFGALATLAQDVIEPIANSTLAPGFLEILFKNHADLISSNITGQQSFWLFVVGTSAEDTSFTLPAVEDIVGEESTEFINTQEDDDYLENTYGVYLPRIDLENIATVLVEKAEDHWNAEFLDNIADIVHAGVAKNSEFLLELSSISCEGNGKALVKFYSDEFENVISLDYYYSEWTPDRTVDTMVLSCIEKFLEGNPRYAQFIDLPEDTGEE